MLFPLVRESLAELKRWMGPPWGKDDYSQDDAEEWCRKVAAGFLSRTTLQFLIISRQDGRLLGNIGAVRFVWEIPSCEIGYWLGSGQTRRGWMQEAVQTFTGMLRRNLGMRRIEIRTAAANQRSRNVALRAGFQLEGILRQSFWYASGDVRDVCVFSWIKDDVP
jgi:RimJ/RimL family protein N-acetyltransferase